MKKKWVKVLENKEKLTLDKIKLTQQKIEKKTKREKEKVKKREEKEEDEVIFSTITNLSSIGDNKGDEGLEIRGCA